MTKQFDALLEQMLSEMMPADIGEIGFGGATKELKSGVPAGEPKGHWAPLQKLSPEDQEKVIEEILKEVFSEKENTYAPTVDEPEQLKDAIKSAIQAVSGRTGLKAAGNWAAKFLSDRLFTLLKNKVKYTTSGGEEVQKDMTQKDFKQALKKALEEAPKEEPSTSEEEAPEEKQDAEIETVYTKAADLNSDDADLQKAFRKLPDDKEMSWEQILKTIGMTKGMALIDAGGLIETEKEKEASEEDEVKALDFDEENDADLSKFDKIIDPYFSTTKGSWRWDD
jgi:hypothetical protein